MGRVSKHRYTLGRTRDSGAKNPEIRQSGVACEKHHSLLYSESLDLNMRWRYFEDLSAAKLGLFSSKSMV